MKKTELKAPKLKQTIAVSIKNLYLPMHDIGSLINGKDDKLTLTTFLGGERNFQLINK